MWLEVARSRDVTTKPYGPVAGGVAVVLVMLRADTPAGAVAREVVFEEAVLGEDLALQRQLTLTGLPLRSRDELHVRARGFRPEIGRRVA